MEALLYDLDNDDNDDDDHDDDDDDDILECHDYGALSEFVVVEPRYDKDGFLNGYHYVHKGRLLCSDYFTDIIMRNPLIKGYDLPHNLYKSCDMHDEYLYGSAVATLFDGIYGIYDEVLHSLKRYRGNNINEVIRDRVQLPTTPSEMTDGDEILTYNSDGSITTTESLMWNGMLTA